MKKLIAALMILPSLASAQVLIPWGEPQEHYQVYGVVEDLEADLYTIESRDFRSYIALPHEAKARAAINPDGDRLNLEIGSFASSSGAFADLGRQNQIAAERKANHILISSTRIELSDDFRPILESWIQLYPDAKLTIDRRTGRGTGSATQKLKDLNLDTFEQSLTNLYRASANLGRLLNLYLDLPRGERLDAEVLKGISLVHYKIEGLGVQAQSFKEMTYLPRADRLGFRQKDYQDAMPFYEAYQRLDQWMIPAMERLSVLEVTKGIPESVWRRQLLEKAFSIYFEDESQSSPNSCQAYSVKAIQNSGNVWIELDLIQLQSFAIDIPQVILEIETLDY